MKEYSVNGTPGYVVTLLYGVLPGLLVLWTLSSLVVSTHACSCEFLHPQQHFCMADFVVKAKVKAEESVSVSRGSDGPTHLKYKIRIIKTLKKHRDIGNATIQFVYTPVTGSQCGQKLQLDKKHLITGVVTGGKLFTSLCHYNGLWDSLTRWQRRGFTSQFQHNCDCEINVCFNDHCKEKNLVEIQDDMCILDLHRDPRYCHMQHSRCMRRGQNQCVWSRTGDYIRCMKGTKDQAWAEP